MANPWQAEKSKRLVRNQAELDHWFRTYRLSFSDPTNFAARLSSQILQVDQVARSTRSDRQELGKKSGCDTLYQILEEVRDLPHHRHRLDAANILNEVNRRLGGDPPLLLKSRPLNVPPPPRSQAQMNMDGTERTPIVPADIEGKMPPYEPGDGLPTPWVRVRTNTLAPPRQGEIGLQVAYRLSQQFSQDKDVQASITNILLSGTNGRGLDPARFLDNPAELVLEMPRNLQFLEDPIPEVDQGLFDRAVWPKLDIIDLRRGSAGKHGPLNESDYIYQFFALAREILSHPEIARKYVIVLRAHPRTYQDDTFEELVNEPAPTVQEVECIIKFITTTFPEIRIKPHGHGKKYNYSGGGDDDMDDFNDSGYNDDDDDDDGDDDDDDDDDDDEDDDDDDDAMMMAFGLHDREEYPSTIDINGVLFDLIEEAQRMDRPYGHLLYQTMMIIAHEMGHYLNTCVWYRNSGIQDEEFDTPRRMRWYQQLEDYEYRHSASYNRFWTRMGEMGEIIEWLLCNYLCDIDTTMNKPATRRDIKITCWNSYPNQHHIVPGVRQISIGPQPGARLFRGLPMVRIQDATELREWLENEANWDQEHQRIDNLLRAPEGMDLDMTDTDEMFTGYAIPPGKKGMNYRLVSRSIRSQYMKKSRWKREYCTALGQLDHNNLRLPIAAAAAEGGPRLFRFVPNLVPPQVVQMFLSLLILLLAIGFDSSSKDKEPYRLAFMKDFVYLHLLYKMVPLLSLLLLLYHVLRVVKKLLRV